MTERAAYNWLDCNVSFTQILRAAVGDSHFVTLVLVKKISGNFSNSPAEWIWSDMFYWFNYGLAEQRCMFWHDRQPDPQIYTGINISTFTKRQTWFSKLSRVTWMILLLIGNVSKCSFWCIFPILNVFPIPGKMLIHVKNIIQKHAS